MDGFDFRVTAESKDKTLAERVCSRLGDLGSSSAVIYKTKTNQNFEKTEENSISFDKVFGLIY